MSTRTVVHLLRHGEVHNPTGVLYGRLPGDMRDRLIGLLGLMLLLRLKGH